MKRINLSEWALSHQVLMVFFMVLVVVAGVRSYFQLGQNEDPEFTVKTMVVRAYLPGATIEETMGGLATATVLTLLFLPACYVLLFKITEPAPDAQAEPSSPA